MRKVLLLLFVEILILSFTQHFSPSKSRVGTFSSIPKSRFSPDANIPADLQEVNAKGEVVNKVTLPISEFLRKDRREESGRVFIRIVV